MAGKTSDSALADRMKMRIMAHSFRADRGVRTGWEQIRPANRAAEFCAAPASPAPTKPDRRAFRARGSSRSHRHKGRADSCAAHRPIAAAAPSRSASRRSEEHTSELQSLMRISYAVFCLKKKKYNIGKCKK